MIEKNIRLQPHHSRDLLVGRRSDGRRPGYQPPGHGSGGGRGRDPSPSGGGGGGGPPSVISRPAPAYTPPPRDVMPVYVAPVTTAKAPPSILSKEPPKDTRGDTPERIVEQIILDEIRKKEKEKLEADWDFQDVKTTAPTTFKPKTKTYEKHVPFTDDPVEIITQMQSPTYYQDKSKIGGETWGERAEDMMPRGGIMSTIGGGLKKIGKTVFGDNPFDIALNLLSFGGYKQAKYAKMILDARKKGTLSNKTLEKVKSIVSTFDKQKKAKGQFTSAQGLTTSQKIAMGKGLESGQELLGLKSIEGHTADLSANDIKLINYGKKHGLTTPTEIKETVGAGFNQEKPPTDAEIKGVLEGTITKPTGIFAAHGGRIDKPLMGRSRDIG